MAERPTDQNAWIAWLERIVLALLLAFVISGVSSLAQINARIDVMIEKQATAARIDEARSSHEARIVAIESSRFTKNDADDMRERFDSELLDLWKEIQTVKANLPVSQNELKARLDIVLGKLEERIRVLETK